MPQKLRRLASWLEHKRYRLAGRLLKAAARLMTQRDVVAVMFDRKSVEATKDFIGPFELRFRRVESDVFVMDLQDGKVKAYQLSVAARAQRQ